MRCLAGRGDGVEALRGRRVVIEGISPLVDDGRFPAKRVIGDIVQIGADRQYGLVTLLEGRLT